MQSSYPSFMNAVWLLALISNRWLLPWLLAKIQKRAHLFPACIPANDFLELTTFSHCWAQQVNVRISLRELRKMHLLERNIVSSWWHFPRSFHSRLTAWALCFSEVAQLLTEAPYDGNASWCERKSIRNVKRHPRNLGFSGAYYIQGTQYLGRHFLC